MSTHGCHNQSRSISHQHCNCLQPNQNRSCKSIHHLRCCPKCCHDCCSAHGDNGEEEEGFASALVIPLQSMLCPGFHRSLHFGYAAAKRQSFSPNLGVLDAQKPGLPTLRTPMWSHLHSRKPHQFSRCHRTAPTRCFHTGHLHTPNCTSL